MNNLATSTEPLTAGRALASFGDGWHRWDDLTESPEIEKGVCRLLDCGLAQGFGEVRVKLAKPLSTFQRLRGTPTEVQKTIRWIGSNYIERSSGAVGSAMLGALVNENAIPELWFNGETWRVKPALPHVIPEFVRLTSDGKRLRDMLLSRPEVVGAFDAFTTYLSQGPMLSIEIVVPELLDRLRSSTRIENFNLQVNINQSQHNYESHIYPTDERADDQDGLTPDRGESGESGLSWDPDTRELMCNGKCARKYSNQLGEPARTILAAFEEEGWPTRIYNPVTDDDKQREAIRGLNRGLKMLRFRKDGDQIVWKKTDHG